MLDRRSQSGDTIIEVAIAFAIFALLAIGAITIMNRGLTVAQESLETTMVRQQMDAQAEVLRYLQHEYVLDPTTSAGTTFARLIDTTDLAKTAASGATPFDGATCLSSLPAKAFWLNPGNPVGAGLLTAPTRVQPMSGSPVAYATFVTTPTATTYGLWIESIEGDSATTKFYDFHIRACWEGLSSDEARTLGTIVRLYVPS